MKCIRCNETFDSSVPELNAEYYTGSVVYSCPCCGKLYRFTRKVEITPVSDEYIFIDKDNWENKVVKDITYENTRSKN